MSINPFLPALTMSIGPFLPVHTMSIGPFLLYLVTHLEISRNPMTWRHEDYISVLAHPRLSWKDETIKFYRQHPLQY